MNHQYEITYGNLLLSPLLQKHIESLRQLRNQNREYFRDKHPISRDQQQRWYKQYLAKPDDIMFMISTMANPEMFIGAIALYDVDFVKKSAEFGRVVIDKALAPEKGIGTLSIKAICHFGFVHLNLERINAFVLKSNHRAIAAEIKAGFSIVGEQDDVFELAILNKKMKSAMENNDGEV